MEEFEMRVTSVDVTNAIQEARPDSSAYPVFGIRLRVMNDYELGCVLAVGHKDVSPD